MEFKDVVWIAWGGVAVVVAFVPDAKVSAERDPFCERGVQLVRTVAQCSVWELCNDAPGVVVIHFREGGWRAGGGQVPIEYSDVEFAVIAATGAFVNARRGMCAAGDDDQ